MPIMLATLIKTYRKANGIPVRDLAAQIGVGYSVLWKFEHGQRLMDQQWIKVAKWALIGSPSKGKDGAD